MTVITGNHTNIRLGALVTKIFRQMNRQNDIMIVSTIVTKTLRTMFCATSPEDKIWRIFQFSDDSENEEIHGYGVSPYTKHQNIIIRLVRRTFETHVFHEFYNQMTDATEFAYFFSCTSKKHQYKLNYVCSNSFEMDSKVYVKAIGLDYYRVFVYALLGALVVAYLILNYEKLVLK